MPHEDLSSGHVRAQSGYKGVIRRGIGEQLWACPHFHNNRDESTAAGGIAARECSRKVLLGLQSPNALGADLLKHKEWVESRTRGFQGTREEARALDYLKLLEWAVKEAERITKTLEG